MTKNTLLLLLSLLFHVLIIVQAFGPERNDSELLICPRFKDYTGIKFPPNPNCHKEVQGTPDEWMKELNCTVEKYEIKTEDNYILLLRRSYCGTITGKYPILIGHGINSNDSSFMLGKEKSVAYIFLKEGYDCWTINFRGTSNSRHVTLKKSDLAFWKFSFHEMGVYDYPAAINTIRDFYQKKNGQPTKVLIIGNSMGSLALSVFGSELPDYANEVSLHHIHIAPVHSYLRNPPQHRLITSLWPLIEFYYTFVLRRGDFLLFPRLLNKFCLINKATMRACQILGGLLTGINLKVIDPKLYPYFIKFSQDTTSVYSYSHCLQNIASFKFRKYDHGPRRNLEKYNSLIPPEYPVSNISVQTSYITSKNDFYGNLKDIKDFYYNKLPKAVQARLFIVDDKKFCHVDYLPYNKYYYVQFIRYFIPILKTLNPA